MSSFLKSWRRGRVGRFTAPSLDVVTRRIQWNIAAGKDERTKLSPEAREAVNAIRPQPMTDAQAAELQAYLQAHYAANPRSAP